MTPLILVNISSVLEGGSTKPLAISAINENAEPLKFVAKVNTQKNIKENFSLAKEILAIEIAKQFGLRVPRYSIIEIPREDLKDFYTEDYLDSLDNGYKFCSEFVEGSQLFNPMLSSSFLKDYMASNVFAFDFLIHNTDRGGFRKKANLLINDEDLVLIDHELILPWINGFQNQNEVNFHSYSLNWLYKRHIFYNYLKSLRKKSGLFDEFEEILPKLNLNSLEPIFDEMDNYNILYGDREEFFSYFAWAKSNVDFIVRTLNAMIK